jgi:S1-C subfamily serine protease
MKVALSILLTAFAAGAALGAGQSSVEIDGISYSNITRVAPGPGGRIIIDFGENGAKSAMADKFPADFLASWLSSNTLASAQASRTAADQAAVDRAVAAGMFREVAGVVYDTRRAPGWVVLRNVKVFQIFDEGALVDETPAAGDYLTVFVKHLAGVGDNNYVSFTALPTGTYTYENKVGDDRTVRAFDCGLPVARRDIPAKVLSGEVAFADALVSGVPDRDVVAALPDSKNLEASGSGFFVSSNGCLVTNHHVVKGARRVMVKAGELTLPATVVRVDVTNDLALVKVTGLFRPLRVSTNEVQLGDPVFTIGFPDIDLQGTQPKYTAGTISSLSGIRDDPTEYQISVQVQPGNSGGPLVDKAGKVAGVIVARLNDFAALRSMGSLPQNVNYAVKGGLLRDFLAAGGEVDLSQSDAVASDDTVATVQRSVALVLVY